MTGRRAVVLLTLLGAGLVLLAGTRTWATVTVSGGLPGLSGLTVPGRATPVVIALALPAAAGAVVLATSGRVVRFLVAAGQVIAGTVIVLNGWQAARDRSRATAIAVRDSLGVSGTGPGPGAGPFGAGDAQVSITIWPWVAAAGGLLILLAGLLALAGGRSWPGPARRYERAPVPGVPPATTSNPVVATARPVPRRDDTPAATWDALSRGEDPTSPQQDPT